MKFKAVMRLGFNGNKESLFANDVLEPGWR
jgi:hypothetical protein